MLNGISRALMNENNPIHSISVPTPFRLDNHHPNLRIVIKIRPMTRLRAVKTLGPLMDVLPLPTPRLASLFTGNVAVGSPGTRAFQNPLESRRLVSRMSFSTADIPPNPHWYQGPRIPPERIHKDYRERILESFSRGFINHLDLKPTLLGPGYAEIRIRSSDPRFENPGGVLHGGAVLSVLDVAGGKAAYTVLPKDRMVVTAQMSTNFTKGVKGAVSIARAQVVRAGKAVIVVRCDLYSVKDAPEGDNWWTGEPKDSELQLCGTALQTLVVVHGKETWSE